MGKIKKCRYGRQPNFSFPCDYPERRTNRICWDCAERGYYYRVILPEE